MHKTKKFTAGKVAGKILVVLLSVLMVCCSKGESSGDPNNEPPVNQTDDTSAFTELTRKLINSKRVMSTTIDDTTFTVSEGVQETDIRYNNKDGKPVQLFILRVDMNNPDIRMKVATPFDKPDYAKQTVLETAKLVDGAGNKVIAGFNGDFYNTTTLVPMGPLHKNEQVIKSTFSDNSAVPQQALSFFAILKNGKPFIGYKNEYAAKSAEIKDATGGGMVFVKNHLSMSSTYTVVDPRTAVGFTDDGIVYWIVADGRNPAYSNGLTYAELTNIMIAFNVKDAVNFDGGGSSTFMIRKPASSAFEVRNRPSDGAPREVAHSWIVVSTKP